MENVAKAPGMRRIGDNRDILVAEWEVEREDIMKLKPLIETVYWFLVEEGFKHPQSEDDKVEDFYWERWNPTGAKEQHIWWRASKTFNKYLRWFVEINYQTLNVTKAEVAYKDKKVSGEKIDVIVRVKCYLQYDYSDLFQKSLAWQWRKMFFNRMYKEELQQQRVNLEQWSLKLNRLLKNYLEITADTRHPATFFPQMGYKDP